MEENVALDSTKKRQFLKSIKSLKKLIKKNDEKVVEKSPEEKKIKSKRVRPERGLVYLSHIPHGFYEHQMAEYFKQFGAVTNARVIRSRRTGRSKGFAFVEFREPAVAQIVAETMNNYLMGKRLIKAAYIPPEKIRYFAQRKNWNEVYHPAAVERTKQKKAFNAVKSESEELKKARKMLSNLEKTKKKLSEVGINYDFMPVDIPLELIKIKQETEDNQNEVKEETVVKPTKKQKKKGKKNNGDKTPKPVEETKQVKKTEPVKSEKEVKPKNEPEAKKIELNANKNNLKANTNAPKANKIDPKLNKNESKAKKGKPEAKVDKKEQEQKQKQLDQAGVKSVENFIKVQESDDESDSSADFDSDEYEKMLNNESDLGSDESEESDDESGDEDVDDDDDSDDNVEDSESGEEESVVDYPPVKTKQKVPQVAPSKAIKKQEQFSKNAQVKRKAPLKAPVTQKKPKFEKQNKPVPVKKQFKKKK